MSLESLNTIGTLATVAIVAATALAALIQLRHLRAGNQINAMLTIGEKFQSEEFAQALELASADLEALMEEPAFRDYNIAIATGSPTGNVPAHYVATRRAALLVGNTYEELGILIKNAIVDRDLFLDRYCGVAIRTWKRLEHFLAFIRELQEDQGIWETFEMVVVLSERYLHDHPTTYPSGLPRIPVSNPWPVTLSTASKGNGR